MTAVRAANGLDVLVSSTMSDAHTWNLLFLQLRLGELGHEVTNLGPCVPDDMLIEECEWNRPDLVVLSSVNGHGMHDALRVIDPFRATAGLTRTPIVIGGKLGIDGTAGRDRSERLLRSGFDAVFSGNGTAAFESYLLGLRTGALR